MTEYKVVMMERKLSLAKMGELLEETLNGHAKLGWKLKQIEEVFVIFEK